MGLDGDDFQKVLFIKTYFRILHLCHQKTMNEIFIENYAILEIYDLYSVNYLILFNAAVAVKALLPST